MAVQSQYILQRDDLERLFVIVRQRGYNIIAPVMRDSAIAYDEVSSSAELPVGWTDEHGAGAYRLNQQANNQLFGYTVGPYSWKKFLFPPRLKIFSAIKEGHTFSVSSNGNDTETTGTKNAPLEPRKYAFFGMRSCDLHALHIQDKIFRDGAYTDPYYTFIRKQLFIIALNCTQAGGTCFCASMSTGPKVSHGYDIALTELVDNREHCFLLEFGSAIGNEIAHELSLEPATRAHIELATTLLKKTESSMGRTLDASTVQSLLQEQFEHPRWEEIAKRCLSCANCTLVCPTCFCTTVEDITDLTGSTAERWRTWDSCFTMDFSYIHGGSIRPSVKSRYRQWMTHKLANWIDQYGISGCVGCGRCITWCPVGIDITAETKEFKLSQHGNSSTISI